MTSRLVSKKIFLLFIKIYGVQTRKTSISLKLYLALNTPTEPSYPRIFGFSKGFADSLTQKYAFFWMWEPNLHSWVFLNTCKPSKTKILEESLDL